MTIHSTLLRIVNGIDGNPSDGKRPMVVGRGYIPYILTMHQQVFWLKKHWFVLLLLLLLLIASLFRFYNYPNRWGLSYDQARDVLVAREGLLTHSIPLIGPFSSAGQFVYGPQWYWILMLFVAVFPNWILSAWVLQTILYVAMVALMVAIGNLLYGRKFGLLLGLLTAVSPAQIAQSTNLTSPSMVGFFAMLSIYCFLRFIKEQSHTLAILLGVCIGTAINVHFQAFGLLFLIPIASLCTKKKVKYFLFLLAGLALPFLPLMLFDLRTNFFESKNFLDYYLYGQHTIYLPNRWLTYAGVFWPNAWGRIIGGSSVISWTIILSLTAYCVSSVFKRSMKKSSFAIITAFLCSFTMLRYFKGNLYDGYLVFLHPYVLILTGLATLALFQWKKWLGVTFVIVLVFGSASVSIPELLHAKNDMSIRAQHWMSVLVKAYPDDTFLMFDYLYRNTGYSLPLVLYMDYSGKVDDQGYRIGFGDIPPEVKLLHPALSGNTMGFDLVDLYSSPSAVLQENNWAPINPSTIYHSTVEWYKDRIF